MKSHKDRNHQPCRILIALILSISLLPIPESTVYAADAIVGGACEEAEFNAALNAVQSSGGGTITFDCGAVPFQINFSGIKNIYSNVTIDGGELAIRERTKIHSIILRT